MGKERRGGHFRAGGGILIMCDKIGEEGDKKKRGKNEKKKGELERRLKAEDVRIS